MISIVIPFYNEEKIIVDLLTETIEALSYISENYEIICIDDGSDDNTLQKLTTFNKNNNRIKVLELSRNFGHQAAYTAGLHYAKGEYVVMMDGDFQDPPKLIPDMYKKIKNEDFDIIYGKRTRRNEKLQKKLFINLFHYIFSNINKSKDLVNVGNFSIMNRYALNAFLKLNEKSRYLPGLRYYIGFKQSFIKYERPDRHNGKSKMSFIKLSSLALDAIFSFSKLPIRLSLFIGIIGIILSITGTIIVLVKNTMGVAITGWTSIMLSMYFFGSVLLFFLGILGEYVFRIFIETKNRPTYIVRKFYK